MTRPTPFGIVTVAAWCIAGTTSFGQQQHASITGPQFDVVSIKLHKYDPAAGSGMRMLPDGALVKIFVIDHIERPSPD